MATEYTIRRVQGPDSFVIADGFESHDDAEMWAEKRGIETADTIEEVVGEISGHFIQGVYHHE